MPGLLLNPYAWLAAGLLLVASHAAVGVKAYNAGQDDVLADQVKLEEVERRTRDAALQAAAEQIAQIEVHNATIRQKTETIVREVPVYRECRHDPVGLQLVNAALGSGEPPRAGELPSADPAQ